ncbi:hypothetical protein NGM37_30585, partial [Streptomyces sp. TRM76130]|nr:hypothetical protein [Streptomyces sp. TRM76130]
MPGNPRRALTLAGVLTAAQTAAVLLATRAAAAPVPDPTDSASPSASPSPSQSLDCSNVVGLAKDACDEANGITGGSTPSLDTSSTADPLSSLAKGCAEAAAWTVDKLSEAVKDTADVDFTNPQ